MNNTSPMPENKKQPNFMTLSKVNIFIVLSAGCLIFNLFTITTETLKMIKIRKNTPYTFLGDRFRGIDRLTGQAPFIGYYTDKNLDDNRAAMQFAQAQFVLTPSILELNNTNHEYIIFDCTNPAIALAKIQEIGAKPLKANPYGIILARHPDSTTHHNSETTHTFNPKEHQQLP